jgi:hypothetical protein
LTGLDSFAGLDRWRWIDCGEHRGEARIEEFLELLRRALSQPG